MRMTPGLIACLLACTSSLAQDEGPGTFLEAYPDPIQARLELRDRLIQKRAAEVGRDNLQGVFELGKLWDPGSTVTVAFYGGDDKLCESIAEVGIRWSEHGNVKFSFRDEGGKVRRWSPDDKEYAADVRVGFDAKGRWSLIGTESRNPKVCNPGEPSMNLKDFDVALPTNWEGDVLHEFGHAVGFKHEHQNPVVPCDFRWEDDRDYEPTRDGKCRFISDSKGKWPGLYTWLSGPPNEWKKPKVDLNFKKLEDKSSMFLAGPFDRDSIMKYDLPSFIFRLGEKSHCFKGRRNIVLSKTDKATMSKAYPSDPDEIRRIKESIREYKKLNP